jgi:hypothetical protein
MLGAANADIKVSSVKGDVYVRHNVQEQWVRVAVGDILKPEDSMKLEKESSATVLIDGTNKLTLPELVIVDLSDLRTLSQEELLLKLAMERIRSVPAGQQDEERQIPKTTTVYGKLRPSMESLSSPPPPAAVLQLNGTHLLFEKGFYATCVLKAKGLMRQYPDLPGRLDALLMVAGALEKMKLDGEALSEYLSIPTTGISPQQQAFIKDRIARLMQKDE